MPFRAISGHRPLLDLLARSIARGTLPPSLVFAGPEGVGKRLTAVALAQALNCERPVDFMIVEPGDSGSIKIDQIRDAIDRAAYRPFEGRRRVVIIDEADALVGEAQNALLKTLEEPPPASVFVLITARQDLLLPTVRSRGHRLRFGPLAPAEIAAVLMREHGFAAAAAHAAAAASDGSLGRALEDAGEDAFEARDAAVALLQSAAGSGDPRRRLEGARTLAGSGDRDDVGRRLLALASLIRDLGLLAVRADERGLANADLKAQLQLLLRGFDGDRAVRAFSAVDRALWALDRNASPKIVADWVALNI